MTPLLIIPCRAGSNRLPGKNTKMLAGKPMYRWAVDAALEADVGSVVISTDIQEIIDSPPPGVTVWSRPPEVCGDVPIGEVMEKILESHPPDQRVTLIQPTSPLVTAFDVECVSLWPNLQAVVSVVDLGNRDALLKTNGALWSGSVRAMKSLPWKDAILLTTYQMPRWRSIDIDTQKDFDAAEAILLASKSKPSL